MKTPSKPQKLSRSKLDMFLNCPRCFYMDRVYRIRQPGGLPFSLNAAVDRLLKKEFDEWRAKGLPHPIMTKYGINAVPLRHEKMEEWRNNFKGITYFDTKTGYLITGAVDDVWVDKKDTLYIVDYKATSKAAEVTLDADWQVGYKRQMEIYQWLFRRNGFKVNNTGYFVYCNGKTDVDRFDEKLEFTIKIIPYKGDDSWVAQAVKDAATCLKRKKLPPPAEECEFCEYRKEARAIGA